MTRLRHEKLTYELRGLIFEVRKKLKTGWSEEIYHQGLVQLLRDKGIPIHSKPRKSIIHLLVEDKYLLNIRALLDQPTRYDFARTKTYLNSLGLKFGLIVNFGKRQLQIYGVSPD